MAAVMWERLSDGRFRVKETTTHYVDIVPMLFNWRIVTTPKGQKDTYDRGWCYQGRDSVSALLAAMAWDPEVEEEPQGWIKQAAPATGRRRPNGDASQEFVRH